jgi:hypothetical protein
LLCPKDAKDVLAAIPMDEDVALYITNLCVLLFHRLETIMVRLTLRSQKRSKMKDQEGMNQFTTCNLLLKLDSDCSCMNVIISFKEQAFNTIVIHYYL